MSGKMYIFPTDILFLSLILVDDTIEDAPKIQLQNVFEETTASRRRSYTQFAEIKRPITTSRNCKLIIITHGTEQQAPTD